MQAITIKITSIITIITITSITWIITINLLIDVIECKHIHTMDNSNQTNTIKQTLLKNITTSNKITIIQT